MKTIWKYPLAITDEQTIRMPIGANILSVQFQGDALCLWAMVDSTIPKEGRHIQIHGTGHDCYDVSSAKYIGTALQPGVPLVWHVFEKE